MFSIRKTISGVSLAIALSSFCAYMVPYKETPCPVNQPVIAYHKKEKAIFLFGGYCSHRKTRMNDLWKFDGEWKHIEADDSPQPRSGHAMVYDQFNNRLILFGGKNQAGELLNDTWSWDSDGWNLLTIGGPAPRQSHRMVFNSDNGNIYLFGGSDIDKNSLADTWHLKNEKWAPLNTTISPPARSQHTMSYDQAQKKMVLFGGFDRAEAGKIIHSDTWEWDEKKGWQFKADNKELARDHHAMAYDIKSKKTILFGGYNQGYLGDTRYWDGQQWIMLTTDGPSARAGKPGIVYHATNERLILFGGWDKGNKPLMDFWQFNSNENTWATYYSE